MTVEPVPPPVADLCDDQRPARDLWGPTNRKLTVGLVLTVTLVAFEALAVATVMPEVKDDLGGLALYGWVFSGFFLGSLLGIVVAGQLVDRCGLLVPYMAGLGLFAVGLAVGGGATTMVVLVAGRVLQGFGAGAIPATAYAAIARGVPIGLRPKMFAVMSTAWVVPGLVGPGAALAITHAWSWRVVFLGLLPFVVLAAVMTAPALRSLGRPDARVDGPAASDSSRRDEDLARLLHVGVLVLGVGAVFAAGSGPPLPVALALIAVGAPLAVRSLLHLLPAGTLRLAPGVPAAVAVRGILTFAFFAADAYVPLAVIDGRGAPGWVAGAALTVASLSWAGASWFQARVIDRVGPRRLDRGGFALLVVSVALLFVMARGGPAGIAIVAWGIGGFAIGMAYAPLSVTVLAAARSGEEGRASAAIQLSDALGVALGTGAAGWIVAVVDRSGWTVAHSVAAVFVLALVASVGGFLAARRLPEHLPEGQRTVAQA